MRYLGRAALSVVAFAAGALLFCSAPGSAQNAQALLERMAHLNPHLKSYTAAIHADVTLHAVLPLSPSLDGTYYHKEPNKDKIVFTSGLPVIAEQFSKVYPHVESPARWNDVYYVSVESNNGRDTVFKLVPRKHGRIDHIDATVDDRLATVVQLRWNYVDGGYAVLDQTYTKIDGNYLVAAQKGHIEVPHYSADMSSRFSDFRLNVPIPDSVFASNG